MRRLPLEIRKISSMLNLLCKVTIHLTFESSECQVWKLMRQPTLRIDAAADTKLSKVCCIDVLHRNFSTSSSWLCGISTSHSSSLNLAADKFQKCLEANISATFIGRNDKLDSVVMNFVWGGGVGERVRARASKQVDKREGG